MSNPDYKVTRALPGEVISGKVPSALLDKPAGTLVRTKNPGNTVVGINAEDVELELCDGTGPAFLLERAIVASGGITLEQIFFGDGILTPAQVGNYVSARSVQELEVEGAEYVYSVADAQIVNGSTAVGSQLTSKGGKFALRTNRVTQEGIAILRGFLAPVTAGNVRIWVEMQYMPLETDEV